MITRALPFASPFALDLCVDAAGGLYVFALFYLGYAYVYSYPLMAGGS